MLLLTTWLGLLIYFLKRFSPSQSLRDDMEEKLESESLETILSSLFEEPYIDLLIFLILFISRRLLIFLDKLNNILF